MSVVFQKINLNVYSWIFQKIVPAIMAISVLIVLLFACPARSQESHEVMLLMNQANEAMQNYELSSAISYLENAMEIALDSPEIDDETFEIIKLTLASAILTRCATYLMNSWPERAIDDLNRIIEMDIEIEVPFLSKKALFTMRGASFAMTARYEEALADFDSALKANDLPSKEELHWFFGVRGYTYFFNGDMQHAEEALQASFQKFPDDPLAHCLDTDLALVSGDARRTLDSINTHYDQCIKDGEHFNNETETLKQYILKNNALPKVNEFCAGADDAIQEDNDEKAIDLYMICFSMEPKNPKIVFNLALAYALNGENIKAKNFYYRYLYLVPDAPDRQDVLEMIEELNPDESVDEMFQKHSENQMKGGAGGGEN